MSDSTVGTLTLQLSAQYLHRIHCITHITSPATPPFVGASYIRSALHLLFQLSIICIYSIVFNLWIPLNIFIMNLFIPRWDPICSSFVFQLPPCCVNPVYILLCASWCDQSSASAMLLDKLNEYELQLSIAMSIAANKYMPVSTLSYHQKTASISTTTCYYM